MSRDGCSDAAGVEQLAGREGPKSGPMQMKVRQQLYGQKLRGRFIKIRAELRRGIADRDIFDLEDGSEPASGGGEQLADSFDPESLTPAGYDPSDPARNHRRFMRWLHRQQQRGILDLVSREDNLYVRDAALDGARWANARLREAGVSLPDPGGAIVGAFAQPIPANTLRLLYQRNYDLLEGLTADVSRQVSETLTRGFAQGHGPERIARDISDRIDSVGLHRATLIARHETMYAANQASLHQFREANVAQVDVLGSDPCEDCAPLVAGGPYPIDDIPKGGPPFHPQCCGAVVPVI